ncbi:MAG: 50S ribosomal protein L18, partial [Cellulosilyticaceae bacterium]
MINKESRSKVRVKKHKRLRNRLNGTSERPRLAVYRSEKHIYAQIIDDVKGVTLASASTKAKDAGVKVGSNVEAAAVVGTLIAKKALAAGIDTVVFDRGGFLYHG